jgi:hypothetical protein
VDRNAEGCEALAEAGGQADAKEEERGMAAAVFYSLRILLTLMLLEYALLTCEDG